MDDKKERFPQDAPAPEEETNREVRSSYMKDSDIILEAQESVSSESMEPDFPPTPPVEGDEWGAPNVHDEMPLITDIEEIAPIETIEGDTANTCPWEQDRESGWFANWWRSFVLLTTSPVSFLANAYPTGRLGRALVFGLFTALFAHFLAGPKRYMNFSETAPMREAFAEMMSQYDWGPELQPLFERAPGFWETEWAGLFGFPIGWCLSLFAVGFLLHAPVRLFGGKGGVAATYKALCYSTPALALGMFPWFGSPLAWAGQCVLCAAGLQIFHRLSTPRLAMIFFFWPLFGLFYLQAIFHLLIYAASMPVQ